MASNTYGAIKLSTAEDVGAVLKKKTGSADGYKPKEWADTINLMGLLPIRTASGTIAHFEDGADDVPLKSLTANIVPIQSGSGTPSPSNPRPISGTDELTLTKTGKNLFDKKPFSDWVTKSPYMVLNDNLPKNALLTMVFIDKDTSVDISGCYLGFVKDTYNGGTVQNSDYHWALQNGTVRGRTDNVAEIGTDLCNYLMMYPTNEATYNKIFSRFDVMILAGADTATTYEPYKSETYTIDLGQEIMGGTADVVGGVGDITYTMQKGGWVQYKQNNGYKAYQWMGVPLRDITLTPYSNMVAEFGSFNSDNMNKNIIQLPTATVPNMYCALDENANINDLQVCYGLLTPTDFTFTGQPINSYLGVNNLWTDSGDVSVEYRADINLLISELGG